MGEAINVGERRPLLVDGVNPAADAIVSQDPSGYVTVSPADPSGQVVVEAIQATPEGTTLKLSVDQGGRHGDDSGITITAVALVVTLGDPIP